MHATSTISNLAWALEHLWDDDDRARMEARQIVCELNLATYDEFAVPECEERGTAAMILDRARRLQAAAAVLGGAK